MKKMLYSTMLLTVLMGSYSMKGSHLVDTTQRKGSYLTDAAPRKGLMAKSVGLSSNSIAPEDSFAASPGTTRLEYENMAPQERAEKHQEVAGELQEAVKNYSISPSGHAAVKRALGSVKTLEMRVNEQSVPSKRAASTTPKVAISVSDSLDTQTANRAEHISNICDSVAKKMSSQPNQAVVDAGHKSLVAMEKAVNVIKKGSA